MKVLNSRNEGSHSFGQDVGELNRTVFYVYAMKIVCVHFMKAYRRCRTIAPRVLNLGSKWRRVVNFAPRGPLLPGNNLGTQSVGGWVDRRAGLDVSEKKKVSYQFRDLNLGPSI